MPTDEQLQLDPYQLEGARMLASHSRAGLFDEPGLGKTAQAIHARLLTGDTRTLVVCPAAARVVWAYQFRLWTPPDTPPVRVVTAETVFDALGWQRGTFPVLVVSYEQATKWLSDLTGDFFDLLIMDEAHYMKNPDSQRAKALLGTGDAENSILSWACRAWLLTGTPAKNDPKDLWVLLRSMGVLRMGYYAFQRIYFDQTYGLHSTANKVKPAKRAELRALVLQRALMRTFEDVAQELPAIRLTTLPIDGDSRAVTEYLAQYPGLSESIVAAIDGEGRLTFDDNSHYATLRALIAEAKAPIYARMVAEEIKGGSIDKLVVFGFHRAALHVVKEHLVNQGISCAMIIGGVPDDVRAEAVEQFQNGDLRVIVANIVSAGTALTLHAACTVDMLESMWTPSDNVQAIRRVRRRGQKRPVLARFAMLLNSIDDVVTATVLRKARRIGDALGKDKLFSEAAVDTQANPL